MKPAWNLNIVCVNGRMTMNPRIKELAEQCTAEGLFNDDSGLYTARINVEKFSQLLITETIKELCQQMYWHGIDLSNYPKFHTIVEKKTKDHFGVE
jgi:hypothetical protein